LGKLGYSFSQNPIYLTQNSIFFNGFPLSSTAFQYLQRLSNCPQWLSANGFLITSTAFRFSFTAFRFPRNPRKSIYGGKYTKDHYLSFVFNATHSPSFVVPAN
jgi:hypothetical protein